MEEDIPKNTIIILLVLTVIISIACTWVVLDQTMAAKMGFAPSSTQSGIVKVDIQPRVIEPEVTQSSGQIAVKIDPNN